MDRNALTEQMKRSKLIIGDVSDTVSRFAAEHKPAPIGAIFHDLDYYSSTSAALAIFDVPGEFRLPRIFNYFDDIIGCETALYNNYTGELLAIEEYNGLHPAQKLASIRVFMGSVPHAWHQQIYIHHDFAHADYCTFVSEPEQHLPLA